MLPAGVTATVDQLAERALAAQSCQCPQACGQHHADGKLRTTSVESDPDGHAAHVWIDAAHLSINTRSVNPYDLWRAAAEFARRRSDHEATSSVQAFLINVGEDSPGVRGDQFDPATFQLGTLPY